ncbi:MAG TPA: hypothetical protein VI451_05095 [Anaerolineales bacterium]|nr:hypothetical protein [Anaerolineales bacterium]
MGNLTLPHPYIVLDACCVINLFASGKMAEILVSIPKSFAVAVYAVNEETLNYYDGPIENVRQIIKKIDLRPLIDSNIIVPVEIESEEEQSAYVYFATQLDDGEAISGAISMCRNWAIATDDKKAIRVFKQEMPHITLVSTLDLVKNWVEVTHQEREMIQIVLENIRYKANYDPRNHPLYEWWKSYFEDN